MPPVPLRVVDTRDEHADALVEQAQPPPAPEGPPGQTVDFACGGCGAVVWRREATPTAAPPPKSPAQGARRVLVECHACGALNVLPPVGEEDGAAEPEDPATGREGAAR